ARAIENQCYVLAPDQWGSHSATRRSFGHSVAFDPWGRQVALAPERACVVTAELDRATLERTRQNMPVRRHARLQQLS
ncbi:MAG: nitrilase-related carbon-nitrogen hydrolase, partial [Myxococcota bacterium]